MESENIENGKSGIDESVSDVDCFYDKLMERDRVSPIIRFIRYILQIDLVME